MVTAHLVRNALCTRTGIDKLCNRTGIDTGRSCSSNGGGGGGGGGDSVRDGGGQERVGSGTQLMVWDWQVVVIIKIRSN